MILEFIRLKNFKGFKLGLGLDEVSVDLGGLKGLIALVGPNGRGKTTLMDNLSPYRIMPTQVTNGSYTPGSFSFYEEVYDIAEREQIFQHSDGNRYRTLLTIDAEAKKTKAHLYRWDSIGNIWDLVNAGGRASTYDEEVEKLFGSPQLFFNSVFRCQEAMRLTNYRKGIIKDILSDLLLLSGIKEKGKAAKAVVDSLDKLQDTAKAQEAVLEPEVQRKEEAEKVLLEAEQEYAAASRAYQVAEQELQMLDRMATDLEKELSLLTQRTGDEYTRLTGRKEALEKSLADQVQKRELIEKRVKERLEGIEKKRIRLKKIVANAAVIREKEAEERALAAQESDITSELGAIAERLAKARAAADKLATLNKEASRLQLSQAEKKTSHKSRLSQLEAEIKRLEQSVERLDRIECPDGKKAACPAVRTAVEDKKRLFEARAELELSKDSDGSDREICRQLAEIVSKTAALAPVVASAKDEARQRVLGEEQGALKGKFEALKRYTSLLPELERAEESGKDLDQEEASVTSEKEADLAGLDLAAGEAKADLDSVAREMAALEGSRTEAQALTLKAEKAHKDHQAKKEEVSGIRARHISAAGSVAAATSTIAKIQEYTGKLDSIRDRLKRINSERHLWATIAKGYSNDGIIPMEIADAGPHISSLANQLIEASSGRRFSVTIDTQDMKDDGSASETFDIAVIDNENGDRSSFSKKSGGERTKIEDAVTKAIALYNAEKTGSRIKTIHTDERDGAISADAKREFFLLKRKVLELGGFEREVFISHSEEAIGLADHRLEFERGLGIRVM